MVFLSSKFKKVFGAELSEIACDDFFTENNISFTKENNIYISNKIELHSGDYIKSFLAIKKHKIHAFYDRASLIALPKNMREEYVRNQSEILQPNSKGLLITLEYEQENTSQRPPFSIQKPEIDMLYGKYFSVEKLETIPANSPYKNSYESAYILTKKFS
jgi:thiopurine S-methyltransferase